MLLPAINHRAQITKDPSLTDNDTSILFCDGALYIRLLQATIPAPTAALLSTYVVITQALQYRTRWHDTSKYKN